MRLHRGVVAAIVTLTAAVGLLAPSANAVPVGGSPLHTNKTSCSGTSCYAKDPSQEGCLDDAKTVKRGDALHIGTLELRWSAACNAMWGRFTLYRREAYMSGVMGTPIVAVHFDTTTATTPYVSQGTADSSSVLNPVVTWWSNMVPAPGKKVCTRVEPIAGIESETRITGDNESQGWSDRLCTD